MPAPEQIVFPAVQVLGIERVDPRTDDLVPFDGPNVVPEQVGPDTPDQRDPLELVVGGERREFPDGRPGTGGIVRSGWRWCTTLRLRRGSCRLSGHGDRCGCTISR